MAAVSDKDYSSYQDIREESGHYHLVKFEELTGLANGSNTVYYAKNTFIVDRNYNDTIDVGSVDGDFIAYVNDVAVQVNAVNVETGAVTLAVAPAVSATVLGSYAKSALSDAKVDKYRKEAIDWAQRKLKGILDYTTWEDTDVPATVKTFVRLYAGALILIRDYGLSADTEESSKDGYKKLASAKSILMDFINEIADATGSTSRVVASGRSDGNLFARNTDLSTYNDTVSQDDSFMRG
jgi:hypothetical protein